MCNLIRQACCRLLEQRVQIQIICRTGFLRFLSCFRFFFLHRFCLRRFLLHRFRSCQDRLVRIRLGSNFHVHILRFQFSDIVIFLTIFFRFGYFLFRLGGLLYIRKYIADAFDQLIVQIHRISKKCRRCIRRCRLRFFARLSFAGRSHLLGSRILGNRRACLIHTIQEASHLFLTARSSAILILAFLRRGKRLIFHLQFQSFCDIFTFAEPQFQFITGINTLPDLTVFAVQKRQFIIPAFCKLCFLICFQHLDLLIQRCLLSSQDFITE